MKCRLKLEAILCRFQCLDALIITSQVNRVFARIILLSDIFVVELGYIMSRLSYSYANELNVLCRSYVSFNDPVTLTH